MSVTIAAAPAFLLYTVGGPILVEIVTAALAGGAIAQGTKVALDVANAKTPQKIHLSDAEAQKIFNKEYKTEILDKALLIRTLQEHGARNIIEVSDKISCDCEGFHLEFKQTKDSPYTLKLSYDENYNPEELVNDLGSEYAINAQEISYNKIKERLEQQNLEIEEEEIYDDNTIVLTVNLE